MTLIATIKTKESIIMSSDSLGRIGNVIKTNNKKILPFKNFAMGIAGDGEAGQTLINLCRPKLSTYQDSIESLAMSLYKEFSIAFFRGFPTNEPTQWPSVWFILAGMGADKKPTIYSLRSSRRFFPESIEQSWFCVGDTSIAEYLCSQCYFPSISHEIAKWLSIRTIAESAATLATVGGQIHAIELTITEDASEIGEKEINTLVSKGREFNAEIHGAFQRFKTSATPQT